MTVLLLGATGNGGPHVVRALLGRGMAPWEAQQFEEMYQLFRDAKSEFVTGDVERVLSRSPRTVEDYLRERRAESPALIGAA
ncbi:MAG TPA: hypothetical protein VGX23_19820 [Actinocrinis sp.]|nr:hypothetical protein [Actinocrinis sp.]